MKNVWKLIGLIMITLVACQSGTQREDSASPEDITHLEGTFDYDLNFLKQFLKDLVVLKNDNGQAQVIVSPELQGRVMSSTARGMQGRSYGWINYDLIASGEIQPHMNAYGGEDRFWLGPEGGQFSIFFPPGTDFTFENWQTPPVIDSEPFKLISHDEEKAVFQQNAQLTNYSGTEFTLQIDRTVRLLQADALDSLLGIAVDTSVQWVGFASENAITNTGEAAWTRENGLLSIWILGMFRHSPTTTIVIPYEENVGSDIEVVKDDYFGKVPEERLMVKEGHIFFKGDGAYRSKIGVRPQRAKPLLGSYDPENQLLTIVTFTLPEGEVDYVNSMWEIQEEPFQGDAVNSYNDGPLEAGGQMGPFYELESSSPAAALKPQETMTHIHRTFHFQGSPEQLEPIAQQVLDISLQEINTVF